MKRRLLVAFDVIATTAAWRVDKDNLMIETETKPGRGIWKRYVWVDMFQINSLHCYSAVPTTSNLLQSPKIIELISGWMLWVVGSGFTTSCDNVCPGILFIMRRLHPENEIMESLRSTKMLFRCLKALRPITAANFRDIPDYSTDDTSSSVCIFLRFAYTYFNLVSSI